MSNSDAAASGRGVPPAPAPTDRAAALEEVAVLLEHSGIRDIRGGAVPPAVVEEMVRRLLDMLAAKLRSAALTGEPING